jgi:hypothetical protein
MAASQDNSLLFSLKELEDIEQGRVDTERARVVSLREAERRAFLEHEKLEREAESRRLEEEEGRRRAEGARRRDEEGRRVAMERAVVERARAEVEARARIELERARAAHEVELENARSRAARRTHRVLLGVSLTTTIAAVGFAVVVSGELRERMRLDAAGSDLEGQERAQHQRTSRDLAAARTEIDDLQHRLEGFRGRPSPRPDSALPAVPGVAPSPPKGKRGFPLPTPLSGRPCGLDGDPLDGCLPAR